ncbi:zinc-dependent alcohol dehydrogenase family protein [Geobacillus zalihae]|uniref:zinc-dependent alcohol dehydrogenase family protein n=1 Tax=Geobacillus zalihae TaxID=213419 RepID=UPI00260AF3F6|nr:zinc-dependent alcohol dehydrogenase family protein [Geobacillus zalihae]WKA46117.1 zinc-dependent alcohol dehydrogenase family protein [Geobacillus zalihae]
MKAARLVELNKPLVIQEIPDPHPGPQDAVIKVQACGVCRSDWHAWKGDWTWVGIQPELPITLGHEFAGTVEQVGREVKNFRVGDRVTAPFHSGCGHCEYCLRGASNLCENLMVYGTHTGFDGAYATYVLIRNADFNLIRLPDNVDWLSAAAIGCRYMTGYHGVIRGKVRPGEWVAVQGAGGVGLSVIQIASAIGAQVIAVDIEEDKLAKAKHEGAIYTINAKRENVPEAIKEITQGGAHVSIDALGIKETVLNSVLSLRKGGRHVQIGLTTSEEGGFVSLPTDMITLMELEFLGSLGNPNYDFRQLLNMVSNGKVNPKTLVTEEIALEDVSRVFSDMNQYRTKGFHIITKF